MAALNVVHVATILAALFVARAGYAVTPAWDAPAAAPASLSVGEARRNAGKSFLDYVRTTTPRMKRLRQVARIEYFGGVN